MVSLAEKFIGSFGLAVVIYHTPPLSKEVSIGPVYYYFKLTFGCLNPPRSFQSKYLVPRWNSSG